MPGDDRNEPDPPPLIQPPWYAKYLPSEKCEFCHGSGRCGDCEGRCQHCIDETP